MAKVNELLAELAAPIVAENGCTLWDTEYVKEAGGWFLRVYIDKEGGVGIADCEAVSRAVSDVLDETDPIEGSYTFEVSSAGADRALKKPEQFAAFLGAQVEVHLYRAVHGAKEQVGALTAYEGGAVSIENDAGAQTFDKENVARVRLHVTF